MTHPCLSLILHLLYVFADLLFTNLQKLRGVYFRSHDCIVDSRCLEFVEGLYYQYWIFIEYISKTVCHVQSVGPVFSEVLECSDFPLGLARFAEGLSELRLPSPRLALSRLPRPSWARLTCALRFGLFALRPLLSTLRSRHAEVPSASAHDDGFTLSSLSQPFNHPDTRQATQKHCACHSTPLGFTGYLVGTILLCLVSSSLLAHLIVCKEIKAYKNHVHENQSILNTKLSTDISFVSDSYLDSSKELFNRLKFDFSVPSCPWLTNATVMPAVSGQLEEEAALKPDDKTVRDGLLDVPKPVKGQPTSSRETTPDRKLANRLNHATWEDTGGETNSDADSDVSVTSLSSQGSLDSKDKSQKRGSKWILTDGEYDLDRGKTCKLSFIQQHISENSALDVTSELSEAINKDFTLSNPERYKISLQYGGSTSLTDIPKSKSANGGKKKKKTSEVEVDLSNNLAICDIVKSYHVKASKAMKDIFGINVEFDHTQIHHMKSTAHSIPYESAVEGSGASFSPVVAILAIGQGLTRPMFLRTKAGSVVTHKITLRSGSLCVLSGRAEVRYKRSVPKDFGVEGEQYYMVMTQKTPDASILTELMQIPFPVAGGITYMKVPAVEHVASPEPNHMLEETGESSVKNSEDRSQSEKDLPKESNKLSELKTPPTVKRKGALIYENGQPLFKDSLDFEATESLLLSETICAAVKRMDDASVTTELIRNHCPIDGTLEEKQRRLQNKLCMSIGEMSMSAANMNSSVNLLRHASPESDNAHTGQLQGDLELLNDTFTNSQRCIEDTLKLVVDNIVEMKSEMQSVKRSSTSALCNADVEKKALEDTKASFQKLSREVAKCSGKINELVKSLGEVKNHLKVTEEEMKVMKNSAVEIMRQSVKDMEGYHNSVFADESRNQIQEIYDLVMNSSNEADDSTDALMTDNCEEPSEEPMADVLVEVAEPAQVEVPQPAPSSGFTFASRISPNLQHLVKSNQKIDVWLITDSIMRHINEEDMNFKDKYRVQLHRIDRSTTESLRQIAAQKPHIIYLHLGINDIQKGRSPAYIMKDIRMFIICMLIT